MEPSASKWLSLTMAPLVPARNAHSPRPQRTVLRVNRTRSAMNSDTTFVPAM
jgi:hypothetical protein